MAFFPWKQNQSWIQERHASFKKLDDGQDPNKKIVSVNFSHAVLSLLDILTLEERTDRLSWNASNELPLYAV